MRKVLHAGDKLLIDYCGPTLSVVNPNTGEIRSAQVFVATLGGSSYTYAEATWMQSLPDWLYLNRAHLGAKSAHDQYTGGIRLSHFI